jgi:hypothetical protein
MRPKREEQAMSDDPTRRAERRLEEHPDHTDEERRTSFYGAQPGVDETVAVDHGGQASEPATPQREGGEGQGVESGEGGDQPVGGSMRPRPDLADEQEERPAGALGDPKRPGGQAG